MNTPNLQELVEQELLLNYTAMYRLAYTYVKNETDAMDIVQESAYLAIKHAAGLQNESYIKSWLFRIVINTSLSLLRKKGYEISAEQLAEPGREDVYADFDIFRSSGGLKHQRTHRHYPALF